MIELRAIVKTAAHAREATLHETVEELRDVVAVRCPGEPCVLSRDADSGVQHDGDEEARLAVRESESCDGFDPVIEVHLNSSSARPPERPPPRPPPLPPADPDAHPTVGTETGAGGGSAMSPR